MGLRADVIIPAFNAERFLAEAITSVRQQTVQPARIIVVDDGSTDGTAGWLARQDDLTVARQDNAGEGAARNRAIQLSDAPVLAFLDADDLWKPAYLETQLSVLAGNADIDASFVRAEQFDHFSGATSVIAGVIPTAMSIRRAAFERLGQFDETPDAPGFFAWFLAAKEAGLRYMVHDRVLVRRRIHDANLSRAALRKGLYVQALKQSLDRRRRLQ